MQFIRWVSLIAVLLVSPAFAQQPTHMPTPSELAKQQLLADWQAMSNAVNHIAQDLSAVDKAKDDEIADLKKQLEAEKPKPDAK